MNLSQLDDADWNCERFTLQDRLMTKIEYNWLGHVLWS